MDMNRLHFLMDKGIVLHGLAAVGYALLMAIAWRVTATQPAARPTWYERFGLALVLIVHGWGLQQLILPQGHLHFGFASSVSITVWLGMLVFWFESLWVSIGGFRLWALPLGILATLLPLAFPTTQIVASADSGWLRIHLGLALSAYCLVSVAALHAILMATSDRHLHHLGADSRADGSPSWRARMLDALPPLLALESLLFRLIWIGFILLTLAIVSGSLVSIGLTGNILTFDHKVVFTLLSWITFGLLLIGRQLRGWRGKTALHWTLTGFALLLLAYTGTRFVMEVVLPIRA